MNEDDQSTTVKEDDAPSMLSRLVNKENQLRPQSLEILRNELNEKA